MTTPGEPQAANHNPFALLRRITCQGVGVWEERVPEESGSTSSSAPPARRWVGSATWPGPRRGSAPSRQGKYYLSYSAYRETWRRLYWAFLSCLSPMMPRGSIRIKRFCMFRFYLYSLLMTLHVSRRPEQVHGPTETPLNENALGLVSQAATQRWGAWTQRALRSGSHQGPESRTGTCGALRVVWFCTQTLHCWSETARAPAGGAQRVWAAPTGAATRSRPVGIKTSSQSIWKKKHKHHRFDSFVKNTIFKNEYVFPIQCRTAGTMKYCWLIFFLHQINKTKLFLYKTVNKHSKHPILNQIKRFTEN